MFNSLTIRVTILGSVIGAALAVLIALILTASVDTRKSFRWVSHSQVVIQTMDEAIANLRQAESGQRGFLLTKDPAFAVSFEERIGSASNDLIKLNRLTSDNPEQNARVVALAQAVGKRVDLLRSVLAVGQGGDFEEARRIVASGHGRELMDIVDSRADEIMGIERALLASRVADAEERLGWHKQLAMFGGPVIAILIGWLVLMITSGIRRPVRAFLKAMERLGTDEKASRIERRTGSSEFDALAKGYNTMSDRLHDALESQREADDRLQAANGELRRSGEILRTRGEVIELLGGMAHRMQAARRDEELAEVIQIFVPRVLPGIPGALYAHNNSRNMLVRVAQWAGPGHAKEGFAPDDCWGLRRGQSHFVSAPGADIVCGHVDFPDAVYHCEPLLAGGEVIGVLYLEGVVEEESRFRLTALSENIASALVNHRLQRGLREQTIRDPLTGLFNRRYLEETLQIEIARASRAKTPLSLVMCDVDHFKRFNDEFGHDAGDTLLQAIAAEMQAHFREGDVVCRFGGEEFTIVAPGATLGDLALRIERLRASVEALNVRQAGRVLGQVSMSFGLAQWQDHMAVDGSTLIQTADKALYRAKNEGRNRAVMAELT